MVILYMATAIAGALVSWVLLWPYGAKTAFASMPFSGSLFMLSVAILIYVRAPKEASSGGSPEDGLDQLRKLQAAERHR